ncbi:MAG: sugar transferase [Candidatus Colwellbacteria bacterium]|nr:sugar transferase [Candidatus Colwellbacteria bacterium]
MRHNLLRKVFLLVGDWAGLYLALFLMIRVSYGVNWLADWYSHLRPFSWIFPIWIAALYATYLYETRFFRFSIDTLRTISTAILISSIASIVAFYAFPPGLLHPRRDMILFTIIYALFLIGWRWVAFRALKDQVKTPLVFLGGDKEVNELQKHFKENPTLGYINLGLIEMRGDYLERIHHKINSDGASLIVVHAPSNNPKFTQQLFSLFSNEVVIMDLEEFYERTLNKVAPDILTDTWFIQNLENLSLDFYLFTKRLFDILFSIFGLMLTIPFYPIIALLIKVESKGPIFFRQERVGKNNKTYKVYKFRTMQAISPDGSAETGKPIYARIGDTRITKIGKILRVSHIDELPQLWNILKGEMSLVGPRPIRPEFMEKLSENIPYYDMRHLVKPGLTGWAQINYGYGITIKDEYIKLQYDIYYAKKQSLMLDLAIVLKTIKSIFAVKGH